MAEDGLTFFNISYTSYTLTRRRTVQHECQKFVFIGSVHCKIKEKSICVLRNIHFKRWPLFNVASVKCGPWTNMQFFTGKDINLCVKALENTY